MPIETPLLVVDCVIFNDKNEILLIERKNTPYGWALPGGFVNIGESVETAIRREVYEETDLELDGLSLLNVFSKPNRDPRQHVVSVAYIARGLGKAKAKDDAKNLVWSSLVDAFKKYDLVFDHNLIIATAMTRLTNVIS